MEMIATIFVIIGTVVFAAIILIVDWVKSRLQDWEDRTKDLEKRVEGHHSVLKKHEVLHADQDTINQQTIKKNLSG